MQNRNMFLYRRQGPKKRPKSGTPRKGRSPQKGLPNSARDLLPIIQPATKALAQMLAGRTGVSGQLGHARAVLAQTERLVAERAHNRLNPAEREEFFEQVARLKLTLSDAESEAEFQAAEEQAPASTPVPVDRERLKAMALSLTVSSATGAAAKQAEPASDDSSASETERSAPDDPSPLSRTEDDNASAKADPVSPAAENAKRSKDPNQLRLPREATDKLTLQPGTTVSLDGTSRRRKPKLSATAGSKKTAPPPASSSRSANAAKDNDVEADLGASTKTAPPKKAGSASTQKLPKGWIIDEEGFVVPGPT